MRQQTKNGAIPSDLTLRPSFAFTADYDGILLRGGRLAGSHGPLLILHGAGAACMARWYGLMMSLAERDVACAGFDFVGHGETGGTLLGSSLASRVQQVLAVASVMPEKPTALFGSSMGAYVAIRALEFLPSVSRLVLVVPGVYDPVAYDAPFGPGFSAIIRRPDSWADSDAFARLAAFSGDTLIVAAEEDRVIPHAIPERLAASAKKGCLIWVPSDHKLSAYFERHLEARDEFRARVADFVKFAR